MHDVPQFALTDSFALRSPEGDSTVGNILISVAAQDVSGRTLSTGENLAPPTRANPPSGHSSYSRLPKSAGSYDEVQKQDEGVDDQCDLQDIKRELTEQNDSRKKMRERCRLETARRED